jgi:hypothetical protein
MKLSLLARTLAERAIPLSEDAEVAMAPWNTIGIPELYDRYIAKPRKHGRPHASSE